jgi:hypothetical protein
MEDNPLRGGFFSPRDYGGWDIPEQALSCFGIVLVGGKYWRNIL